MSETSLRRSFLEVTRTRQEISGMSLAEVMLSLAIIIIALLTLVAYVASIHRAARESKSQAVASIYARDAVERVRSSRTLFDQASAATGLVEIREEVLLEGELDARDDEVGRKGATEFQIESRAVALAPSSIYNLTVQVSWQESGRERKVVIESRAQRP